MMICWQFLSLRAINLQFLLAELSRKEMKQWSSWMQSHLHNPSDGREVVHFPWDERLSRWSIQPVQWTREAFCFGPRASESIIYTFDPRLSLSANGSQISPKIASLFTLGFINGLADSRWMKLRALHGTFSEFRYWPVCEGIQNLILALAESFYSEFPRPRFLYEKKVISIVFKHKSVLGVLIFGKMYLSVGPSSSRGFEFQLRLMNPSQADRAVSQSKFH